MTWQNSRTDTPWGLPIGADEKLHREAEAERCVVYFEELMNRYPRARRRLEPWKHELLRGARRLAAGCLGFSPEGVGLLFTRSALDATEQFIRQARAFDPALTEADLHQAIRNLWVVHALQIGMSESPKCSPATFAYSMLYPCTDNFLDDDTLSAADKWRFGEWLERRLSGESGAASDPHSKQVDQLIALIEDSYPRQSYPEVYLSLHAIHQAQLRSLAQQNAAAPPDPETLLRITLAKGGSSVLVDGYLVKGALSDEQAEFAFAYGVLLQLMDDLQDLRTDTANAHTTLITQAAAAGELENIIARLWSFTHKVLSTSAWCAAEEFRPLASLIEGNCRLLLLHSAATNRDGLSLPFLRELETASPFRFDYLATRENSLRDQYKRVVAALRGAKGGKPDPGGRNSSSRARGFRTPVLC